MKNFIHVFLLLVAVVLTAGCSTNVGTIQNVFPISNTCKEDADCQLVAPVVACPTYECGSCGTEVVDNSKHISVNKQNYYKYLSNYRKEQQCSFDLSNIKSCPDCITTIDYTEDIEPRCIDNICTVGKSS